MGRTFLLPAAVAVALMATSVTAQTAIRCEVNGKVVYSDTACAPGSAAKAVAPVQETAQQRASARAAGDQIRKDTAYVDKRLDDRYKRDTVRPMGIAASASDKNAAGAAPKRIAKAKKSKKAKQSSKKAAGKAAKTDSKSSRSVPEA